MRACRCGFCGDLTRACVRAREGQTGPGSAKYHSRYQHSMLGTCHAQSVRRPGTFRGDPTSHPPLDNGDLTPVSLTTAAVISLGKRVPAHHPYIRSVQVVRLESVCVRVTACDVTPLPTSR